jgi:hypothetical protein
MAIYPRVNVKKAMWPSRLENDLPMVGLPHLRKRLQDGIPSWICLHQGDKFHIDTRGQLVKKNSIADGF